MTFLYIVIAVVVFFVLMNLSVVLRAKFKKGKSVPELGGEIGEAIKRREKKALQAEYELGLFLPCNLIVYEKDGKVTVSAFDPLIMTQIVDNPNLKEIAVEVREKLERVIQNI